MIKKVILVLAIITIVVYGGDYYFSSKMNLESIPSTVGQKKLVKLEAEKPLPVKSSVLPSPVKTSDVPVNVQIMIRDFNYSPASVTVKKGTKITWTNLDNASHSIVSIGSNLIDSPTLTNGKSWSAVVSKVGTIEYNCGFHGMMRGKIIVTE